MKPGVSVEKEQPQLLHCLAITLSACKAFSPKTDLFCLEKKKKIPKIPFHHIWPEVASNNNKKAIFWIFLLTSHLNPMMYPLSFYFCSGSVSTSDSCVFLDGGDSFGENLAFGEMARWWLLQLGLVINTVVALVVDGIKCKQGGREGGKVCTIDLVWVLLCPLLIFLHLPHV